MAKKTYNPKNANSILKYGELLLGRSLRELHPEAVIPSGKGGLGQAVEKFHYGYKPNSDAEPDFKEAGLELKCTPLKELKKDKSMAAKERLVLNIINYIEEAKETFETSRFWKKNKLLLLMFYLHEANVNPVDMVFKLIRNWKFPKDDLKIIKDDWNFIHTKILHGQAHELTEGDTLYLAACMKGSKAKENMRDQPGTNERAQQRAYSLKTGYSRFKHVIKTASGRYRRLIPIELERLNMFPDNHTLHPDVTDARRAFLMGNALVCGIVQQIGKSLYRFIYEKEPVSTRPIDIKRDSQPKLNFGLFSELNPELKINKPKKSYTLDMNKSLLVGFVKEDNTDYFLDGGQTKIYYTGKTKSFPSTVALNKLYYFMPYIKGKGIKDLYLIRIARIGCKAEIHPESNDKDPRLVFELEYLESLPNYMMLKPNIFNTYRNTVLGRVMGEIE